MYLFEDKVFTVIEYIDFTVEDMLLRSIRFTDSSVTIALILRVLAGIQFIWSKECVQEYIESGFDGWVLKLIDFKRLEAIIVAIGDEQIRTSMLYRARN
jgi:hypothetical protein